jgi:Zn-dependent M28 family amino/carboxypeptidase
MSGRKFATAGSSQAQNYIISSLIGNNVNPFQDKFRHPFKHKLFLSQKEGNNIIGYVKGTTFPNQYIVISAHYDHLGKTGSRVFNGADDNASGTAAVLAYSQEISRRPLKHSIIFLFTDGEEVNLLGAKAFINQQQNLLPNIMLNINIDMIAGSNSTKKLHYIDNRLDNILDQHKIELLASLSNNSNIKIKRGFKRQQLRANNKASWINASDHASFNRKRIPFIYFGVGEHKNYHTTNDDFDNVNLPFFINASQSILQYVMFFDENIQSLETKS